MIDESDATTRDLVETTAILHLIVSEVKAARRAERSRIDPDPLHRRVLDLSHPKILLTPMRDL
jgi:hypothetical protein